MNASKCVVVQSSWIAMAILMCDNTLSVLFKDGACCNYPRTTQAHFSSMLAAPSKGRWLRHNLYKILPYRRIALPCPAAGCIRSACCAGVTLPTVVHATATGAGACDGTYRLVYNPTSTNWETNAAVGSCVGGGALTMSLVCQAGVDQWNLTGPFGTTPAAVASCSPLAITFAGVDFTFCGGASGATVTVTI
jgi:hypothetical protein